MRTTSSSTSLTSTYSACFTHNSADRVCRKNSAQKTMHKMFGQDPRALRPANRNDMNTRFKLVHSRSKKGRKGEKSMGQEVGVLEVKDEACTPALSDITAFGDMHLRSPQQDSIHSFGSDLASPGSTLDCTSPLDPIYSSQPREDMESPFRPPVRNDTVFSTSTQMSTNSVKGIRDRLNLTTTFAKQVVVIMKRFTIGGSNPPGYSSSLRMHSDLTARISGYLDTVPDPGLSLPGDFIVARKYMPHHLGWCAIADDTSEEPDSFYITSANEEWCDLACDVQNGKVAATTVDHFGNTPLHFFASLESDKGVEITLELVEKNLSNPLATNRGGQTFLHVLSAAWFTHLEDLNSWRPLRRLLFNLFKRGGEVSKAPFYRDVYGRTFFHQLARYVHDPQLFTSISQWCHFNVMPRDAFGLQPPRHFTELSVAPLTRKGTTPLTSLAEETEGGDVARRKQVALLSTVNRACLDDDPICEDSEGRNGLHCLAEVDFEPIMTTSTPGSPTSEKKRKRGQSDASDEPKPVERRADSLATVLDRVSREKPELEFEFVNHYDKAGHTPLMAFATRLTDAADKSGHHTGRIIDLLSKKACIDMRNRQGETALLMAARVGNKNVVSKLLDCGANLCARDKHGRWIMQVLDDEIAETEKRRDTSTYARLEAIKAMLAGVVPVREEGDPGFLDEWRRPLGPWRA